MKSNFGNKAGTIRRTTKHIQVKNLILTFIISIIYVSCSKTGALGNSPEIEKDNKPNIIYILADDMGVYDLGCYGQQMIKTPHIDKMAAEGIRFTQHYAGSTVCAPSRGTLMTGLHTGHAYIKGNFAMESEGNLPLPENTETVAKLMKQAGYTTGIFGKWGLGGPNDHGHPNRQGFDESFCYLDQRLAHEYYPGHLWKNFEKVALNGEKYSHDLFVEEALEFIKNKSDEPFSLYLPFTIPHTKLQVPDLGPYENESWTTNDKKYAAMITRMDRDIGRIFALLDSLGLDENTVVFFSSDNGGTKTGNFFKSNGPLRGYKTDAYEGGIRAPLIVRWPERVGAGTTSGHISAFWDMLPTFCEIAGVASPVNIDGISFLPELLGQEQEQHDFLVWEYFSYNYSWKPGSAMPRNQLQNQAVRMGKWKGIRKNLKKDPDSPLELYDLSTDISEQNDLSSEFPEIAEQIKKIMDEEHTDSEFFKK